LEGKINWKCGNTWRLTIQFKHYFLSYLVVQNIDTYVAKQCSHFEFPYFVIWVHTWANSTCHISCHKIHASVGQKIFSFHIKLFFFGDLPCIHNLVEVPMWVAKQLLIKHDRPSTCFDYNSRAWMSQGVTSRKFPFLNQKVFKCTPFATMLQLGFLNF